MQHQHHHHYTTNNVVLENHRAKFVYQLILFVITTSVGLWLTTSPFITDLLIPYEERQEMRNAKETVDTLVTQSIMNRQDAVTLTSHELRMAACLVNPANMKHGFEAIGGMEDIKKRLFTHVLIPLKYHEQFSGEDPMFPRPPRGVLFSGKSGCGKTMMARAIAKEAGVSFLNVSLSDMNNKYVGESEKLISAMFSLARKIAPCVLFMDEIDGAVSERSVIDQSHVNSTKAHLLSMLDAIDDSDAPIVVIGCTNCAARLDKAMRRRLPIVVEFELPTTEDRFAILKAITIKEEVDIQDLVYAAALSIGFSGSDLQQVYREAQMHRMMCMIDKARASRALAREDLDAGIEAVAKSMDAHASIHI